MNRTKDIRQIVSKSYARAVEQSSAATRSCCSGPSPQGIAATLTGYSRETLAALPADALAGKVASIRVVGRKPEEVLP
jgi:hypothetical protein